MGGLNWTFTRVALLGSGNPGLLASTPSVSVSLPGYARNRWKGRSAVTRSGFVAAQRPPADVADFSRRKGNVVKRWNSLRPLFSVVIGFNCRAFAFTLQIYPIFEVLLRFRVAPSSPSDGNMFHWPVWFCPLRLSWACDIPSRILTVPMVFGSKYGANTAYGGRLSQTLDS